MTTSFSDIIPIKSWTGSDQFPLIIAGPCSAESEEQVLQTAKAIAKTKQATIFRAGVWKARTRPGTFEGAGNIALDWLQKVKKETGLLTAVEVANTEHVELALKKGIDVLWIGARTTVNPFYIQEIANALKGVDIPVLVKNPTHPELQLWIGAIERFYNTGIKKIAAIHRGFYSFEKSHLRNTPNWSIAIDLKTAIPNLPIICDPSHIAGKRNLVSAIAQQAMNLGMDGLMIETHINPAKALSDVQQQLNVNELEHLLQEIQIPSNKKQVDIVYESRLEEFRELINKIDAEILEVISKRMNVVEEIGEHKQMYNSAIFQLERWLDIINTRKKLGTMQGLDEQFVKNLFAIIHAEALSIQQKQRESNTLPK